MHAELRDLMAADQADRAGTAWDDDPDGVVARDAERARRVIAVVDAAAPGTLDGDDLFAAALVLQHGPRADHQLRAAGLALAAAELGHPQASVLHAAAVDRALMREGRPQRYGTQSIRPLAELLAEVDGRIAELEQLTIRGDDG